MIRIQGVSKKFKIYATPADRLKEKILRRPCHHEYAALSDISFEVGPGETLGIIGENGAGKSTLLKILSGILLPDTGSVEVTGKITGLLELGTGFNPELTGLQNIFMNGTFLGMTHEEIEAKKDTIIGFAELGDFINEPIKTYSSGMLMRLGFAIAIHADPECFLVDEALSVGDAYFQQKCMRKIQEFKESGGSIIFVSHDMNAVKVLCDNAIMLEKGEIIIGGYPKEVTDYYLNYIVKKMNQDDGVCKTRITQNQRNKTTTSDLIHDAIKLVDIQILTDDGREIGHCISEDTITIKQIYSTKIYLEEPHFGFFIRNRFGQVIFESNTYCMSIKTMPVPANSTVTVFFTIMVPLIPGEYSISLGISNKGIKGTRGDFKEYLGIFNDVKNISILKNDNSIQYGGIFNMNPTVNFMVNE